MIFRLFAALVALLALPNSSQAFDPGDVFDRYFTQWGLAKGAASYGSAEKIGDAGAVFKDITLGEGSDSTRIETLTLEDVATEGAGGFLIGKSVLGKVTKEQSDFEGRKIVVTVDVATASGVRLLAPLSQEPMVSRKMPMIFEAGPVNVTIDGIPAMNLTAIRTQNAFDAVGENIVFTMDAPDINLDFTSASPKLKGQMAALGFEKLQIDVSMKGSWNPSSGRVVLEEYRFSEANSGALLLSLSLDGYDAKTVSAMRQFSERQANLGAANGEAKQEAGKEFIGLLRGIKLTALELQFEDRSITRKLLTIQAEATGAKPDELAPVFAGMAGDFTSALLGEAFGRQLVATLGEFLANPGKISLSANPKEPVAVTEIVEAWLNSPNALVALLNAKVAASR